ncbi:hypothetical protein HY085_03655 [Candidatus Gottesmanbacteria bacterium]|nr:hypothetical protein [Candidatus Gottesmanbacteria bacterium]
MLKALSGLFINMAGAWYILAFITGNFAGLSLWQLILVLTKEVFLGTLLLIAAVFTEKLIQNEQQLSQHN